MVRPTIQRRNGLQNNRDILNQPEQQKIATLNLCIYRTETRFEMTQSTPIVILVVLLNVVSQGKKISV